MSTDTHLTVVVRGPRDHQTHKVVYRNPTAGLTSCGRDACEQAARVTKTSPNRWQVASWQLRQHTTAGLALTTVTPRAQEVSPVTPPTPPPDSPDRRQLPGWLLIALFLLAAVLIAGLVLGAELSTAAAMTPAVLTLGA